MGTYRDDHEAALARASALEAELEQARADEANRSRKVAALEAELAKQREGLQRAELELAKLKPREPVPPPRAICEARGAVEDTVERPAPSADPQAARFFIGLGVAVLLFAILMGRLACKSRREDAPVPVKAAVESLPDDISALVPELRKRGGDGKRWVVFTAKGVTKDGKLHPEFGEIEATFFRRTPPVERPVDPSVPLGAAPRQSRTGFEGYECTFLKRNATEWIRHPLDALSRDCLLGDLYKNTPEIELNCSPRTIWQRAIADGAPPEALAQLDLYNRQWSFKIDDERLQFDHTYDDDCLSRHVIE